MWPAKDCANNLELGVGLENGNLITVRDGRGVEIKGGSMSIPPNDYRLRVAITSPEYQETSPAVFESLDLSPLIDAIHQLCVNVVENGLPELKGRGIDIYTARIQSMPFTVETGIKVCSLLSNDRGDDSLKPRRPCVVEPVSLAFLLKLRDDLAVRILSVCSRSDR